MFFKNYNNAKKVSFNLEVIESHVLVENKSHLSDGLKFATPTEKANYVDYQFPFKLLYGYRILKYYEF